ncbi:glutamate receptor 3-like isoform X1 [Vespa velutina]|uniref:glutamate receptor 3-like isoform X1 n=1 Tax=Vespa velutina TaxID=202808 RepID=UPI001FB3BD2E|nr:glutamate receptor 3-like isoform X1 [Vespa velutina]
MSSRIYIVLFVIIILFGNNVVIGLNVTTQDYLLLITKVYDTYESSSVFFVDSGRTNNLQISTMLHAWSREISRQGIFSISINFSELKKMKYYQISRPLFVIIISTWENLEEFSKVTKEIDVSLYIWFVLFVETANNTLEKFCKNPIGNIFNLNFDTEMLILCYDEMILKEWYSIQGNNTITSNFAIWKPGKDFSVITKMSLYNRRSDLFGTVLRVGWVKDSSFIGAKDNKLNMLLGEIVTELSKMMNFTTEILDPVDAYGSWNKENETWTGVIGQLISGIADIGVAEFTVTTRRLEAIDFTLPFLLSRNRLYMKEQSGALIQWSAYFKTFSFGIWAMLILVITTTPILLTLIKTKGSFSGSLLSENYIHVWGIYCQQGLAEFPTEPSLRLAFISIFVSAIIVSAAYSASLISFLTVTTESLPFSSLDDFANARTYHLIVFGNSADYDMFANAKDEVIMKMMELMKPKKQLPTSLHNGFDQVCREKVAFYTTEEMKKTINLYLSCKINYIETGRSDSLAMTLPKGSPFKGLINYHLQKFIDNGIMNRLRGSFIIQPSLSRTSHSAVSLWDVTPILAVLSGGTILGIIILIIERTYHHYKMKRKFSRSNLKILQNGLNVPKYSNVNRIDKNYILEKLNRAHKINDFKSSINYFP